MSMPVRSRILSTGALGRMTDRRPPGRSCPAPTTSRIAAQSTKTTCVMSKTSRWGERPRISASRSASSGVVAMSSSPRMTTVAVPAVSRVSMVSGGAGAPGRTWRGGPGRPSAAGSVRAQSPEVPAATDAPADHAQDQQEQADDEHDDADRPDDSDLGDEADEQQNKPKDDHGNSCPAVASADYCSGGAPRDPAKARDQQRRDGGRGELGGVVTAISVCPKSVPTQTRYAAKLATSWRRRQRRR